MSDPMEHTESHHRQHGGPALALTIAALLLLAIFQTIGVMRERHLLGVERMAQEPSVEQGQKLRTQLQTIAGKVAELADSGDVGARNILDFMHREGVTITPPKQPAKP